MKNLAIIIGIDKYQNASDLIACKNDAEIVYEIINKSKKYEDIIYINGENDHRKILKELEELKLRNENDEIGEIFFYFSGHGHSEDNRLHVRFRACSPSPSPREVPGRAHPAGIRSIRTGIWRKPDEDSPGTRR